MKAPAVSSHASRRSPRGAFTLVEMLIVIAIILILVGLLVAAVGPAIANASTAQVKTEISDFENGITNFKVKFGIQPPSGIVLFEAGADGSDGGGNDWDDFTSFAIAGGVARSRGFIRRIWPQFNYAVPRDINKDGDATDVLVLSGPECLVFFLGGVRDPTSGALTGFSSNPLLPFQTGGNRVGPFFEFEGGRRPAAGAITPATEWIGRLRDLNSNDMPEYLDTLPSQSMPYVYASSYDGRGYLPGDLGGLMADVYRVPGEDLNGNNTLDAGEDTNGNTVLDYGPAYKDTGFQIISPGMDGEYGTGGSFDADSGGSMLIGARRTEEDNITNFHGSRLGQ